jgi:hypothetical protein
VAVGLPAFTVGFEVAVGSGVFVGNTVDFQVGVKRGAAEVPSGSTARTGIVGGGKGFSAPCGSANSSKK